MNDPDQEYEQLRQLHVDCRCACYDRTAIDNCCFERASTPYKYQSELKTTYNTRSTETRYYIKICDEWSRTSRADYFKRLRCIVGKTE